MEDDCWGSSLIRDDCLFSSALSAETGTPDLVSLSDGLFFPEDTDLSPLDGLDQPDILFGSEDSKSPSLPHFEDITPVCTKTLKTELEPLKPIEVKLEPMEDAPPPQYSSHHHRVAPSPSPDDSKPPPLTYYRPVSHVISAAGANTRPTRLLITRATNGHTLVLPRKRTAEPCSPSPPSSDRSSPSDVVLGSPGLGPRSRSKMQELAVKHRLISDQDPRGNGFLVLSPEERRTLIQEGYNVPNRLPLSKTEEESLKIVRRKIKNKLSAQESRRKRKEYMDTLEHRVQNYHSENASLRQRVKQLENSNRSLTAQLRKLQNFVGNKVGDSVSCATQTSVCLTAFILLFAVFVPALPNTWPKSLAPWTNADTTHDNNIQYSGVSRLLSDTCDVPYSASYFSQQHDAPLVADNDIHLEQKQLFLSVDEGNNRSLWAKHSCVQGGPCAA